MAWAIAHAAELGADPHRVFIVGHSAGAYNAAMLAVDPRWLAHAGLDRTQIAGVADGRVLLPGVGHFAADQAPAQVSELMLEHLAAHPV